MMPKYRQNTNTFHYYNCNPKGLKTSSDCVVRAIAGGTGLDWKHVYTRLSEIGLDLSRIPVEKATYTEYLFKLGWAKNPQPRKENKRKYTVKEFCELHSKGAYIIKVANHLTYVEDGIIYDTWNCENKTVGNYWSDPL